MSSVSPPSEMIKLTFNGDTVIDSSRTHYRTLWAETTHQMQRLRDNPVCADEEFQLKQRVDDQACKPT